LNSLPVKAQPASRKRALRVSGNVGAKRRTEQVPKLGD